jgi:uncharacterized protein (DUF2141 family)
MLHSLALERQIRPSGRGTQGIAIADAFSPSAINHMVVNCQRRPKKTVPCVADCVGRWHPAKYCAFMMKNLANARLVVLLMMAAVIGGVAPIANAGATNGIQVVVKGLRNDLGRVGCALYNGPEGFSDGSSTGYRTMSVPKQHNVAICDFTGVPAGTYAVSVLDDTNMNGKMDFNLLGLPKKGYGFSNDAKAVLSGPSFQSASFYYDGTGSKQVPINIVYWLH